MDGEIFDQNRPDGSGAITVMTDVSFLVCVAVRRMACDDFKIFKSYITRFISPAIT